MILEVNEIVICFAIFVAKILELSITTFRMVLIARDEKLMNTLLCFIQMFIWVVTTGSVITEISSQPGRCIAYIFGCAIGCYLGMVLDEKIAIGENMLNVITKADEEADRLIDIVRKNGYAVTVIKGEGKDDEKYVLMIATKRKKQRKLVKLIKSSSKNAMIINETVSTNGGYL